MATVLNDAGIGVTPDDLIRDVYVPGRRGSFQAELKATIRKYDRLAYTLEGEPERIYGMLADGQPVLVMQNLGLDWYPKWHYAVIVGIDTEKDRFILRSGTKARRIESYRKFIRSWSRADNWAIVALTPGHIPASAAPERYIDTLVDAENRVTSAAFDLAIEAGLQRWPTEANLQFVAGNHARKQGKLGDAAEHYRQLLRLNPDHVAGRNNFADLLFAKGCISQAKSIIEPLRNFKNSSQTVVHAIRMTIADIDSQDSGSPSAQCTNFLP